MVNLFRWVLPTPGGRNGEMQTLVNLQGNSIGVVASGKKGHQTHAHA